MRFTWRAEKAAANARKHSGVTFAEASTVFDGEPLDLPDFDHSHDEVRIHTIGPSSKGRLLLVAWTDRSEGTDEVAHIISARPATPAERRLYRTRGNTP